MLSLADAVNEALVKNERLVNQSDGIAQADLGLRLARNTFRPKITPNVFGSLGRSDVSSQTYRVDVSQKLVTGTELRLSTGTASAQIPGDLRQPASDVLFYNADTTLTVSQPLLRGFGRSVSRRGLTSAELRREEAIASSRLPSSRSRSTWRRRITASCRSRPSSRWRARACCAPGGCAMRPKPSSTPASCRSSTSCVPSSWCRSRRCSFSMRSRRSKTRAIS